MTNTLIVLAIISIFELAIWLSPIWNHWRKAAACVVIVALSIASGWLVGFYGSGWTWLILIGSVYRMINLLRLVEDRAPLEHMARVTSHTSLQLISAQGIVLLLYAASQHHLILGSTWFAIFGIFDVVMASLLLVGMFSHLRETRSAPLPKKRLSDQDLPTVSVAIPARNETDSLEACLESLIASEYPKLEILVLDDCSQNKRTPQIIKDFAQAGVRFIAGKVPPNHWLAKNYAYEQLAEEASGEILLFCGVDTRFQPDSIATMVQCMLTGKNSMLSILPQNTLPKGYFLETAIIHPARYAWELALPRGWLRRPPVLSTCWLIRSKLLHDSGGFKAVTNTSSVESYFARATSGSKNGYRFLRSGQFLGLTSHKSIAAQRSTAIRTRYPQTHRRPEIVMALSLLEIGVLTLPYVLIVIGLTQHEWLPIIYGAISVVLLSIFYTITVEATYQRFLWRSVWILPFATLYDVALLNTSMWRYEFGEVIWKDRNVCIPFMQYGDEGHQS